MKYMLITKDPAIAAHAEACGVHRIFLDMETLGKSERQGHLDTHKAAHSLADVRRVRRVLNTAELMVRVNPLNRATQQEVDSAIEAGADRLMLPMFGAASDVQHFLQIVSDRVPITFLAEIPLALTRLPQWVKLLGPDDQVHFDLNDLSLAMGLDFLFEPLAARMLDYPASILRDAGITFGIGGVAKAGQGELPVEWVLGEHERLGSDWAILSRAFHGRATSLAEFEDALDLRAELAELQRISEKWATSDHETINRNQLRLREKVMAIASTMRVSSRQGD